MSHIAKFRGQVKIARELGHCVVQTADEAQALLDEIEGPKFGVIPEGAIDIEEARERFAGKPGNVASVPPDDSDDDHAH